MAKKRKKYMSNQWAGFWIFPDGKVREIVDHFIDVQSLPRLYGVDPEQAMKWKPTDRERVLRMLMKRGFIRIRGHERYTTFEFQTLDNITARYIVNFIKKSAFWPSDRVALHELATKRHTTDTVKKVGPLLKEAAA